jgi:hypothetical protein
MSKVKRPLPDRVCSTKLKKQAMSEWVNEMLDRFGPDEEPCPLEKAIERADKEGNIKPLRGVLLRQTGYDLGRFLRKPKREHGQHFPRVREDDPVEEDDPVTEAAIDAKIIWWLWKCNYPKQPIGVNAKQIAADRHKVTRDEVENKSKKLSAKIPPSNGDFGKTGFLKFPRRKNPILFWWDADY